MPNAHIIPTDEAQGRLFEDVALTAEEQDERDEAAELANRFATELDELQAERERQIDRAIDERRNRTRAPQRPPSP